MRRTWWYKPFSVLFTLWFPLVLGEPSLLQPCPTHGAMVAATSSAHHHAMAPAAHAAHGGHADASPSATTTDQSQAPGHQHHQCTCIGCCVGSVAAVLASPNAVVSFAGSTYEILNRLPTAESLPRPAPDYARPFTTGPPRA